MEFGLLGPLVVNTGGSPVTVTAGKQRVVLAVLLLRTNEVVPAGDLAEAVWGRNAPDTARVTLQNYVKRLRQTLGPAGYERIVTLPAGYLLRVEPGELDLARFTELAASGRAAAAAGAWDQASQQLCAALALWRGEPLADVPSPMLASQVLRLAGMRMDVLEARVDADLHLGRHQEVVAELRALVVAEPLRERLHELLMLALYRSGQQAAALGAYRRARQILIDQVGIEPGPGLRTLNQQMLKSDPGLQLPPPPPAADGGHAGQAQAARPCMLPAAAAGFTGRSRELRALSAAMTAAGGGPGGAGESMVITAICGTAGVGKTALAVHWARQQADRFPDGQLYVNLRGFGAGDPVPPAEALRGFLDELGVPATRIPANPGSLQALYRSMLAGKRILAVLDNAVGPDQVRPLLPGTPTAAVLVTSRSELASLAVTDGARMVSLDVLTAAEARQLLSRRIGPARVAAEQQAADELAGLCARLPLALAITAARAAAHPGFTLAGLASELREAGRLDVLSTGDDATDIRAVFSWSYRSLTAPAARMFRLLGAHPGPDVTAAAAASLAGTDLPETRRLLRELTRCHLLAELVPARYAFHDLLRDYAAEQAAATDSDAERLDAIGRLLDHYLLTARAAALLLNPSREPVVLPAPRPGVSPERLACHQQARDWLEAEEQVLLAAITLAERAGFDTHAWQLPWTMTDFLDARGRWDVQDAVQRIALRAVRQAGDKAGQAVTLRNLAHNCARLGDYDQARARLSECPGLYQQLGDRAGEARVHQSLSWVAERQGRYADALVHDEQALGLLRAIGHRAGQAFALSALGWHHALLGDHQQARTYCRQALDLYRELGDRAGEADTWDTLGYAAHQLGQHAEAITCYGHAIRLLGELGACIGEAETLTRLGDARRAAGDDDGASDAWQRAIAVLDDLRHPDAAAVRDKLQQLRDGLRH